MRRLLDYVKKYKKIIIVAVLLVALICAVYFINKSNKSSQTAQVTTEKTVKEVKLTQILSTIEGVGATDVMINEGEDGIHGVIIVCEGANNIMVKNDIINAVSTALNIPKDLIAIYSMN